MNKEINFEIGDLIEHNGKLFIYLGKGKSYMGIEEYIKVFSCADQHTYDFEVANRFKKVI